MDTFRCTAAAANQLKEEVSPNYFKLFSAMRSRVKHTLSCENSSLCCGDTELHMFPQSPQIFMSYLQFSSVTATGRCEDPNLPTVVYSL